MNTRQTTLFLAAAGLQSALTALASAQVYTPIDYPAGPASIPYTEVWGIDGGTLVGWAQQNSGPGNPLFGFRYDGVNFTPLNYPGAAETRAFDIDGGAIVGSYRDDSFINRGFLYNGSNWSPLEYPGSFQSFAYGVDRGNVVGYHLPGSGPGGGVHGFLYDGTTYSPIDYPGSSATYVYGIEGDNIVGSFSSGFGGPGSGPHGFLYDGVSYSQFDYPGSIMTQAYGISGDNIVGSYTDNSGIEHGFVYDGQDWQTIDPPFSNGARALGVDGDQIVGSYGSGPGGRRSGFQTTKPVPPQPITFRFTGEITSVEDELGWFNGAFEVGETIGGDWTIFADGYSTGIFEDGIPRRHYDFYDGPNLFGLPSLPAELRLEAGDHEYTSYTRIPGGRALSIQLIDDGDGTTEPLGDFYSVVAELPFPDNFYDFTFDPVQDPNGFFYPLPRMYLEFSDETGVALDSLELPLTAPDLTKFTYATGVLSIADANGGGTYAVMRFRIDRVSAVPEPGAGVLMVCGGALAVLAGRRINW